MRCQRYLSSRQSKFKVTHNTVPATTLSQPSPNMTLPIQTACILAFFSLALHQQANAAAACPQNYHSLADICVRIEDNLHNKLANCQAAIKCQEEGGRLLSNIANLLILQNGLMPKIKEKSFFVGLIVVTHPSKSE